MRDRPTPAPFRRRLASFLGRDESEVLNEYSQDSKMKFRLFTTLAYLGGRPVELFRQLLTRISKLTGK